MLLGAEFNAELEHECAQHEGIPPGREQFAIAKDTRKLDDEPTREAEPTEAIRNRAQKPDDEPPRV